MGQNTQYCKDTPQTDLQNQRNSNQNLKQGAFFFCLDKLILECKYKNKESNRIKDKPKAGGKSLQNTYLVKYWHPKYTKKS